MHHRSFYYLFLLPAIFAILALQGLGFGYKAGVTISCLLIIIVAHRIRHTKLSDFWWIIIAFIFSIIGDWFLSNKGDSFLMFATGIGLYFLAHAGYLVYALRHGRLNKVFTAVVLGVYLVFFILVLRQAIDEPILLYTTLIYLLISCLSLGASAGIESANAVKWSYFSGITLILFSDTIISFKEFTSYQELNFLILPTYYAAHMLITYALVVRQPGPENDR